MKVYLWMYIFEIFIGDAPRLTSLCPALGEMHSVIRHGMCPPDLQHPNGKEIQVLIIGAYPFVIFNEKKELTGGADIQIIEILAKKFGFIPKVTKASNVDNDGGMVDRVK